MEPEEFASKKSRETIVRLALLVTLRIDHGASSLATLQVRIAQQVQLPDTACYVFSTFSASSRARKCDPNQHFNNLQLIKIPIWKR